MVMLASIWMCDKGWSWFEVSRLNGTMKENKSCVVLLKIASNNYNGGA